MNVRSSSAVVLLACFIAPLTLDQPVTGAGTVLLGVYYGAPAWKMSQVAHMVKLWRRDDKLCLRDLAELVGRRGFAFTLEEV